MRFFKHDYDSFTVHARDLERDEVVVTNVDEPVTASDELLPSLRAALGSRKGARRGLIDWFDANPRFTVEAVVVNEPRDLELVEAFQPRTLSFPGIGDDARKAAEAIVATVLSVPSLERLAMNFDPSIDVGWLAKHPRLHTLLLSSSYVDSAPVHLDKLANLRALHLDLREVPVLPAGMKLEELRLSCTYCATFTFERLANVRTLRTLMIEGPQAARRRGLSCRALGRLEGLEVIVLEEISATGLKHLEGLERLRELTVHAKSSPKGPESLDIRRMPHLTHLFAHDVVIKGLAGARALRRLALSSLDDPHQLSSLRDLEELHVAHAAPACDLTPLAALPNLSRLQFDWNYPWRASQLAPHASNERLQIRFDGTYRKVAELMTTLDA